MSIYDAATGKDDQERMLLAGAKAYAADIYKGARDIAGDPAGVWELLQDHDKAACMYKARIVLRGAGVLP